MSSFSKDQLTIFKGFLALLFVVPQVAWGYIDPGVTGMLFQAIFSLIFGFLMVWFIRPYRYIVDTLKSIKLKVLKVIQK